MIQMRARAADMPDIRPESRWNAKEAARLLGMSTDTLRRRVKDGSIRQHFGRLSPRPYYLGRDILSFWRQY